ncbi:TPA: TIGR03759 family integrating conjugative element protein [Pseudomonas putida]|jgi:integrating conjugative element protein (TIGR03759 family)|uniref:TIGR03759 family integrating conjugative element protein n=4 Tax=Pseudomonas TaxID=286 RepID=A0AAX0VSJ7_9PSED|nr:MULTISPECIES: TIGR03759 family integrating conjugative element protein [Pseudomonas]EKJ7936202.1 TIGR03759 family integrating conjugative element protein [Pseudomonas aeruginosa]AGN83069.1 integrating conjugative element protein [Pseudomonas putida H8234]EKT4502451.1 TIGR03759 family integrating conjugative element protein [Pseudomonas putida]EKU2260420.1 TIGR03759 family integrating conjugative element protein [Pseudomonas aeruginosa]EKU7816163.1 TIGR03759 family integrating conjugative el
MVRFISLSLLLFPICLVSGSGWSAPATVETQQQSSEQAALQQARSAAQAKAWGLTDDEWSKFERLQSGPRQYWSPHLDPLTTLGVEADSDQERQRYAELQVRLEAKRAERELAYQKAYSAAWGRLFPGLRPVQGLSDAIPPSSNPRYAVFVEDPCSTCEASLRQWLSTGAHLDIYLVGSQGDDARIRQWARKVGITPAQVGSGQVTLNHDRGRWFALGASRTLPARFQQVEGKWQRVD